MSMSSKVIIPWEERPAGCKDVLWRSVANPIIPRDLLPTSNSIFNSAVAVSYTHLTLPTKLEV